MEEIGGILTSEDIEQVSIKSEGEDAFTWKTNEFDQSRERSLKLHQMNPDVLRHVRQQGDGGGEEEEDGDVQTNQP